TGIQRRRVAPCTALSDEDVLACFRFLIERIRVRRRLQRIDIQRECVQCLVRQSHLNSFGAFVDYMIGPKVHSFCKAYQGRVAHQVADPAMQMCGSMVDVFPFLDADEIRDFAGVIEASVPARKPAAAKSRAVEREDFGLCQGLHSLVDIILYPRHGICLVRPHAIELRAEWLAHHIKGWSPAGYASCEYHPR